MLSFAVRVGGGWLKKGSEIKVILLASYWSLSGLACCFYPTPRFICQCKACVKFRFFPFSVHFTTNKLRQQATRPVVSPQQENSAGVSTVRNPLLRRHSSILFLPETRADNVPKNISFYFSSFLWDRVKKQTLQSKEINHAINQGPPPYPPTTKSRSCVYLMKVSPFSPAWKSSPSFPHIVAIKSIIHLNIKIFVMKKERIAISLLESQSVETDIFSNFQQPHFVSFYEISRHSFFTLPSSEKAIRKENIYSLFKRNCGCVPSSPLCHNCNSKWDRYKSVNSVEML